MRAAAGIPLHVRASDAAAAGQSYAGQLRPKDLPRLRSALAGDDGALEVSLTVSRAAGQDHVRGRIAGALELQCLRCLGPTRWRFELAIDWRLVYSEAEEQRLLSECEPVLVEDDQLRLREWVEDEVLLALPLAPHCETTQCAATDQRLQ